MEIERKWAIEGFPAGLPQIDAARMEQRYLTTRPVVRIRREERGEKVSRILCIKGPGTLAREEIELSIPEETYDRIAALIGHPPIVKAYRAYRLPGGEKLEVSRVSGATDAPFYYAEVEFATLAAAKAFVPPAFLGEELTDRPGSSMGALWESRYGRGTL